MGNQRIAFGGSLDGVSATTGQFGASGMVGSVGRDAALTASNSTFVNLPAAGFPGAAAPAALAATLFSPTANRFLNLEISALQAEGRGQLVSSPRIITTDQNAALIEQGVQIPYVVTGEDGPTVEFRSASLRLEIGRAHV